MRKHRNADCRNDYLKQVGRALHNSGFEEGVRQILERCSQLEVANKRLEKEIAHHMRTEATFRKMALTDELTGLYNRRGFLAIAEQQLKLAHRMKSGFSIVYFDVDGMKSINDMYGHDAGDQALKDTAQILTNTFRESDIIARLGGDEFIVFVMPTTNRNPTGLANRLREETALSNAQPNRCFELSLSAGLVRYDSETPSSLDQMISRADEEMYAQKRNKRARLVPE